MVSRRSIRTSLLGAVGAGVFTAATMFTGIPAAETARAATASVVVADAGAPAGLPAGSDVIPTGWGHGGWGHGGWGHGGWGHGGWGHGWVNPGRINGFIHSGGRGGGW